MTGHRPELPRAQGRPRRGPHAGGLVPGRGHGTRAGREHGLFGACFCVVGGAFVRPSLNWLMLYRGVSLPPVHVCESIVVSISTDRHVCRLYAFYPPPLPHPTPFLPSLTPNPQHHHHHPPNAQPPHSSPSPPPRPPPTPPPRSKSSTSPTRPSSPAGPAPAPRTAPSAALSPASWHPPPWPPQSASCDPG